MSDCGHRVKMDSPWPFEVSREQASQLEGRREQQCDLLELERRVSDATCYTRDHPQPIFYGRWNT